MNFYITTGTADFMKKVVKKHAKEKIVLAHGDGTTVLFHETEGKTVFEAPRKYEVIGSSGELSTKGFFSLNHIPVTDEGRPIFEHRFSNRAGAIENEYGFIAFRLLRPIRSNTYVVFTQWTDSGAYNRWKNSSSFEKAHAKRGEDAALVERQNIFQSASYVTTYQTENEEETKE